MARVVVLSFVVFLAAAFSLLLLDFSVGFVVNIGKMMLILQSLSPCQPRKTSLASPTNSAFHPHNSPAMTSFLQQFLSAVFLTLSTPSLTTATATIPSVRSPASTSIHHLLPCAPAAPKCSQRYLEVAASVKKHRSCLVAVTCAGSARKKFAISLGVLRK
jgi:hypothetical protein